MTDAASLLETIRPTLDREYEIQGFVGRGSLGLVYKAVERTPRRIVALRVVPPDAPAGLGERVRREARVAANLVHTHIVPVYKVAQAPGLDYYTMKFVDGCTVEQLISGQGALPIPVVVSVLRPVVRALAYAHSRRVIHRDVRGANIFVDKDGTVALADLGVTRALRERGAAAAGKRSALFASPELCAGRELSPQSDQYSVGVLAFRMLTGRPPFEADTPTALMGLHISAPPPEIAPLRPDAPPELIDLVHRSLAKNPADRYPTTLEMLAALQAAPLSEEDRIGAVYALASAARGVSPAAPPARPAPPAAAAPAAPRAAAPPRAAPTPPPATRTPPAPAAPTPRPGAAKPPAPAGAPPKPAAPRPPAVQPPPASAPRAPRVVAAPAAPLPQAFAPAAETAEPEIPELQQKYLEPVPSDIPVAPPPAGPPPPPVVGAPPFPVAPTPPARVAPPSFTAAPAPLPKPISLEPLIPAPTLPPPTPPQPAPPPAPQLPEPPRRPPPRTRQPAEPTLRPPRRRAAPRFSVEQRPPQRRGRLALMVLVLVVVGGAAAAVFLLRGRREEPAPPPEAAADTTATPAPAPPVAAPTPPAPVESTRVRARAPAYGWVRLSGDLPSDAIFWLDDDQFRTRVFRASPGEHNLEVETGDFRPWETKITVRAGDTLRVQVDLVLLPLTDTAPQRD